VVATASISNNGNAEPPLATRSISHESSLLFPIPLPPSNFCSQIVQRPLSYNFPTRTLPRSRRKLRAGHRTLSETRFSLALRLTCAPCTAESQSSRPCLRGGVVEYEVKWTRRKLLHIDTSSRSRFTISTRGLDLPQRSNIKVQPETLARSVDSFQRFRRPPSSTSRVFIRMKPFRPSRGPPNNSQRTRNCCGAAGP